MKSFPENKNTHSTNNIEQLKLGALFYTDVMHTIKNNAGSFGIFNSYEGNIEFFKSLTPANIASMRASIETGKIGINYLLGTQQIIEPVNVRKVVELVATAQAEALQLNGIKIEFSNVDILVNANLYEIMSGITVLIDNATKYAFSTAGSDNKKISINFSAEKEANGETVLTTIFSDNGVGLSDEKRARIFEPKQSDGSSNWHVGLDYLAQKVQANSGIMPIATQTSGGGLTITMATKHPQEPQFKPQNFLLTAEQQANLENTRTALQNIYNSLSKLEHSLSDSHENINQIKSAFQALSSDIAKGKNPVTETKEIKEPGKNRPVQEYNKNVLIIEDNPINAKLLVRHLKQMGYDTICVTNGKDAIEQSQKIQFGLVICDFQIIESTFNAANGEPIKTTSGIDVAKALHAQGLKAQFIPFSGTELEDDHKKIFDELNSPYRTVSLGKPCGRDALQKIMNEFAKLPEQTKTTTPDTTVVAAMNLAQAVSPAVITSPLPDLLPTTPKADELDIVELFKVLSTPSSDNKKMPQNPKPQRVESQTEKRPLKDRENKETENKYQNLHPKKYRSMSLPDLSSHVEKLKEEGLIKPQGFVAGNAARRNSMPEGPF